MTQTFKCDCGTVCNLEDGEDQTAIAGDGTRRGVIARCKCCGKVLNSSQ